MNSYFFSHVEQTSFNSELILNLNNFSLTNKRLIYLIDKPLTDKNYSYGYDKAVILLCPGYRISFLDLDSGGDRFEEYIDDVIEDLSSISDKYQYKEKIGRARSWKDIFFNDQFINFSNIEELFDEIKLTDPLELRKTELLISLFTGSINDISKKTLDVPIELIDKVKQKIQLFDGEQTRFIYGEVDKKQVTIQGLSGTGKTELLLHKIKDIYVREEESRIFFTCHSKILSIELKKRIPDFFNFMKVEQQIDWNKRLWCERSWGSTKDINSGAYRYICAFYGVIFLPFNFSRTFGQTCRITIDEIKKKFSQPNDFKYAFDYMFIDESQDFEDEFFELCTLVTRKKIYIAGDIFQNIYDDKFLKMITPDYLLGKCYRTDPKTLMFAHAIGMRLFEKERLRWLDIKGWEDCGYNVEIEKNENKRNLFHLTREPLRRFEDIDADYESIKIEEEEVSLTKKIVEIIKSIMDENKTVNPEDIGIIFLDESKDIYAVADALEIQINNRFGLKVNKTFETKRKIENSIFISNRYNVKGLEFPFVICVTKKIHPSLIYRNTLYTMLTRSFLKTFLVLPKSSDNGLTQDIKDGLVSILNSKKMVILEPTDSEKEKINTRFKTEVAKISKYDLIQKIFKHLNIDKKYQESLMKMLRETDIEDEEQLSQYIEFNYNYIKKR